MSFPEWLQFVFIPNLQRLAVDQSPWPKDCAVAPMADHYFGSQQQSATRLIRELEKIDGLISGHSHSEESLTSQIE